MTGQSLIRTRTRRATPGIDAVVRHVGKWPLAGIVAAMLAGASAFFCYAMPQRVLDAVLAPVGVAGPIGTVGRTIFLLVFAGLAGLIGWLAVTLAGNLARTPKMDGASETDDAGLAAVASAFPPGTIEGAPPPLPARRSDVGPGVPDRRPIFADADVPAREVPPPPPAEGSEAPALEPAVLPAQPLAEPEEEAQPAPEVTEAEEPAPEAPRAEEPAPLVDVEAPHVEPPLAPEPVTPPEPAEPSHAATEALPELPETVHQPEPEESAESLELPEPPQPPEPPEVSAPDDAPSIAEPPSVAEVQDRTIAALMARFERGLDARGAALPPPPTADQIAAFQEPLTDSEDTLRAAIEALQRISARPR